jgi:acetyltransferase-like isoleucine patch superfamily enzyme
VNNNSIIYKNVKLGSNVVIEPFCIIGIPPAGSGDGEFETVIGDNALIRSHTVIYAGNTIGTNFSTGHHAVIREHNDIGNNVSIGTLASVEHHLYIGNGVRIHSQAFIPEYSRLETESWIGPNVVLTNAKYPRSLDVKETLQGVVIGAKALIGANATLLPGIKVGRGALVGAGSLVAKDVEDGCIVAGNPAVFKKYVYDMPQYKEWLNENPVDES